MNKSDELRMTHSGLLMKNGEKIVRICFERNQTDYAEGILPKGIIEKSSGFTEDEINQLVIYMQDNVSDIMNQASQVHFMNEWLGKK